MPRQRLRAILRGISPAIISAAALFMVEWIQRVREKCICLVSEFEARFFRQNAFKSVPDFLHDFVVVAYVDVVVETDKRV